MLEAFSPAKLLIADKAYDADRLRTWLQDKGIEAVIPGRAARAVVYPLNRTDTTTPERYRAHVRTAQELEAHRDEIRPACHQLSSRHCPRRNDLSMASAQPRPSIIVALSILRSYRGSAHLREGTVATTPMIPFPVDALVTGGCGFIGRRLATSASSSWPNCASARHCSAR